MSILQPLNAMSVATTHTENNPRIVSHNRPAIRKEVANGQHMSIEDWWKNTGNDIYNKVINPTPKWNLEKPAEYQPDGALKAKQDFWDASRKYDQGVQQPVLRNNMLKTNGLDFNDVKAVQQWLTDNKFDTKGVDGMYGANTKAAIDELLSSNDFVLTQAEKEAFKNFQNNATFVRAKQPAKFETSTRPVISNPTPGTVNTPVTPVKKQPVTKTPTEWYTGTIQDNTISTLDNSEEGIARRKNANEIREQLFASNSYLRAPHNYSYASHYINGKEYPIVVTKKLGVSNKHNDQSFYYDPETEMYAVANERRTGQPQGFATYGDNKMTWYTWDDILKGRVAKGSYNKQGGTLIKKHQQGGNVEDIQAQVKQLVQAVAAGDQQAAEQVKQIMEAAKNGDQDALQIAQMIQAEIEAINSAKRGAKLNYIKSLKGDCPDGEEVVYFQKGGQLCKACQKKHDKMIAEKGKKLNPVEEFKKGRKTKKC